MTDVTPNFKDNQGECGCGCNLYGTLRAKAWRNGVTCVRQGCACRHCLGKRSRAKGDGKARRARKALSIPGANTRHEELWGGSIRVEMKAGKSMAGPVWTRFLLAENQSEQDRPVGDGRPFAAVFMPDGSTDGLVVFRLSRLDDVLVGLAEQRGLIS